MSDGSFSNLTDQVVKLLRDGMLAGRWRGTLPGRDRLADELGVSHTTMEQAMRRLAKEGLLASAGAGRRRSIVLPKKGVAPHHFRVRILAFESAVQHSPEVMQVLERLKSAGFSADVATKALLDLGMDAKRVARFVQRNPADAWVVAAGSREVLEWFCEQPAPVFAMFGVKSGLPLAGIGVLSDIQPVIRRLVELGHRRIVLLIREASVKPTPSLFSRQFLEALQGAGIKPGSYNLPAWGYQPEGLHRCLESYYQGSRPTAIITSEALILHAVRDHLARRQVMAPRDVSLISLQNDPSFSWCDPLVAHFTWNDTSISRRVVRWARNVARGTEDRRQTVIMARFVEGGTIGPASRTDLRGTHAGVPEACSPRRRSSF